MTDAPESSRRVSDQDAELALLREACGSAGIDLHEPELLGLGDSATFAVNDDLVAKVTRWPAQRAAAHRDVGISRWLASAGLPAVVAVGRGVDVEDSVVTFWRRLPATRAASPVEIATYLRRLHATAPPPELGLSAVQPFVRVEDRIARAAIRDSDRQYLRERLADLTEQWSRIGDLPAVVIHGDPHGGNVRVTPDGTVLVLDLERFALGPAEWDLTLMASEYDSFRWIPGEQYRDFADTYGRDVLDCPAYPLLREIRELRMTTWLANKGEQSDELGHEVQYRISCLRGLEGPRPWSWQPT